MAPQSCRHHIGPVHVEHHAGLVIARCMRCDTLLSGWLGAEWECEAIELRGVMVEVKDHLYRHHAADDFSGCEALRRCAWDIVDRHAHSTTPTQRQPV